MNDARTLISLLALGAPASIAMGQDQAGPSARVPGQGGPVAGGGGGEAAITQADPGAGGATQTPPAGPGFLPFILMGVMAFMVISMIMSGRKQKKETQALLASLARGDTVQTAAGIIGVIGEIRDDLVVLKIDESTHTKMKVTKSSIVRVVKASHERASSEASEAA